MSSHPIITQTKADKRRAHKKAKQEYHRTINKTLALEGKPNPELAKALKLKASRLQKAARKDFTLGIEQFTQASILHSQKQSTISTSVRNIARETHKTAHQRLEQANILLYASKAAATSGTTFVNPDLIQRLSVEEKHRVFLDNHRLK